MITTTQPRLAVLIDAENISHIHAPKVMETVRQWGNPIIRRAYGDWRTSLLNGWKKHLEEFAIYPHQMLRHVKGKNSGDAAIIIQAMEVIYERKADSICIVSSDSDFTALAGRIRESGMRVYGLGMKQTMRALVMACDEFVFIDVE